MDTCPPPRDFIIHSSPTPSPWHIFFLPGNPGLVEYYAGFLTALHQSLNDPTAEDAAFHVAGCSFAGFECSSVSDQSAVAKEGKEKLYSITDQTDFMLSRLRKYTSSTRKDAEEQKSKKRKKVILIGHSFGTFVATEILKRIQTEQLHEDFDVMGAILLFPPIPDLERSPRGEKLASILRWKYLPDTCSLLARCIHALPLSWSSALIRYATAFPAEALETTRAFFGSEKGVAQALYMAREEIDQIKPARWISAFEAMTHMNPGPPKIRIFFGKDDHWVSNDLRDVFVYEYCDPMGPRKFGQTLDVQATIDPSVDGDETSVVIPHDFSIRHSEHVVPYVAEYINEMMQ